MPLEFVHVQVHDEPFSTTSEADPLEQSSIDGEVAVEAPFALPHANPSVPWPPSDDGAPCIELRHAESAKITIHPIATLNAIEIPRVI